MNMYLFNMPVESAPLTEAIAAGWADGSLVLPGMILCHVPHQVMEILQKKNIYIPFFDKSSLFFCQGY